MTARRRLKAIHDTLRHLTKHGRIPARLGQALDEPLADLRLGVNDYRNVDEQRWAKTCAMMAELLDSVGRRNEAREMGAHGDEVFSRLPQRMPRDKAGRDRIRELVRYVIVAGFVSDYRLGNYSRAAERLEQCLALIESGDTAEFPCHATRAQALFYLGHAKRRLLEYDQAMHCFASAIALFDARAEACRERTARQLQGAVRQAHRRLTRNLELDLDFSRYRVALCLLSMGRVEYIRGQLGRAESYALSARTLMLEADDLNRAWVDLLLGSIVRNRAGATRPAEVKDAIGTFERAMVAFERVGHLPAIATTSYEFAVARLVQAAAERATRKGRPPSLSEAVACLGRTEELANDGESKDDRLLCKCLLRRSRLERVFQGNRAAAVSAAERAETLARENPWVVTRVDALVTLAQARLMDPPQAEQARRDAQNALDLSRDQSPHVTGTCRLVIAKAHIIEHRVDLAEPELEAARSFAARVDHAGFRELLDEVSGLYERERLRAKAFMLKTVHQLQFDLHCEDLREFLYKKALAKYPNKQARADALGITRTTLNRWHRRFGG